MKIKTKTNASLQEFAVLISEKSGVPTTENQYMRYTAALAVLHVPTGRLASSLCENTSREAVVTRLECHKKTQELFAVLKGECILAFCPPTAQNCAPEPAKMQAFCFQAGDVILIRQGVWHSREMPYHCDAVKGLMLFAENTEILDFEQRNIPQVKWEENA